MVNVQTLRLPHLRIPVLCRTWHDLSNLYGHTIALEAMSEPGSHVAIGWPRHLQEPKLAHRADGSHIRVRPTCRSQPHIHGVSIYRHGP